MAELQKRQYIRGDSDLPTADFQIEWTTEMIQELIKCEQDIVHFASNHFFIRSPDKGRHQIDLYDAQRDILKDLQHNRFLAWVASRQVGKTTLMTIYALWLASFFDDQSIIIVANKESTAKMILKRIQLAYKELANWIKPGVTEWSKTSVEFANGSFIKISTTSGDAARGESCSCLILDEAAFIRREIGDEFFKSIIPVISSSQKAKIFMVSTPNGTENKFYDYYSRGEVGKDHKDWNGWHTIKTMWYDIPRPQGLEKFKKDTIASLDGDLQAWRQEFCCEFLATGAEPIDKEALDRLRELTFDAVELYDEGDFRVFVRPRPNRTYVIGVDTGEGVGADASVACVLDITDLEKIELCASYHTNKLQPYVFAEKLFQVAKFYGNPYLCIERNGTGGQCIDAMRFNYNYQHIVHYTKDNDERGVYQRLGIFSHTNSKYTAVTNMRYWINSVKNLYIYDRAYIHELENFIRRPNGTWGAKADKNDDRVAALFWALFILETKIFQKYFHIHTYDSVGKPLTYEDPYRESRKKVGSLEFGCAFSGSGYGPRIPNMVYQSPNSILDHTLNPPSFEQQGWMIVG
jgi:hypothetical protein